MAKVKYEMSAMTTDAVWKAIYRQRYVVEQLVTACSPWRESVRAIEQLAELIREADSRRRAPQLPWDELADSTSTQVSST